MEDMDATGGANGPPLADLQAAVPMEDTDTAEDANPQQEAIPIEDPDPEVDANPPPSEGLDGVIHMENSDTEEDADEPPLNLQGATPSTLGRAKLATIESGAFLQKKPWTWDVNKREVGRYYDNDMFNDENITFGMGCIQKYLHTLDGDATRVLLVPPLAWEPLTAYNRFMDEGRSEQSIAGATTKIAKTLPYKDKLNKPLGRKNVYESAEVVMFIIGGGLHWTTVVVTNMKTGKQPAVAMLDSLPNHVSIYDVENRQPQPHSEQEIRRCLQTLANVVWTVTNTPGRAPSFARSRYVMVANDNSA
jgi:hypothetical protein